MSLLDPNQSISDSRLVGYWDMSTTISVSGGIRLKDLSGYGNHGTCKSGATVADCKSTGQGPLFQADRSMLFDGVDDHVDMGNAPASSLRLNGKAMTIVARVNQTACSDRRAILTYGKSYYLNCASGNVIEYS